MRIWIDLSNSPHPLLFAPIAGRLERDGHEVLVTARDNAQTVELARERWDAVEVIGTASPPGRGRKGRPLLARIRRLASWARSERPDAALSHNSYAQIVAARALGIPAVTAMDYEHQPANHLAFRLAGTVLLPAALDEAGVNLRRMGLTRAKTRFYDGLKEELYLGDFTPDPRVTERVGVDRGPETVLVVARTPPSGALYHRSDNPLFVETLQSVCAHREVRCVVLSRRPEQRRAILELGLPNAVVPEHAVDARALIHASDLVIGAGGTMTREAALLGVPTISVFAGRSPAVERWLERTGRLRRLGTAAEVGPVRRRRNDPIDPRRLRARGAALIGEFISAVTERRTAAPPVTAWADAHG